METVIWLRRATIVPMHRLQLTSTQNWKTQSLHSTIVRLLFILLTLMHLSVVWNPSLGVFFNIQYSIFVYENFWIVVVVQFYLNSRWFRRGGYLRCYWNDNGDTSLLSTGDIIRCKLCLWLTSTFVSKLSQRIDSISFDFLRVFSLTSMLAKLNYAFLWTNALALYLLPKSLLFKWISTTNSMPLIFSCARFILTGCYDNLSR